MKSVKNLTAFAFFCQDKISQLKLFLKNYLLPYMALFLHLLDAFKLFEFKLFFYVNESNNNVAKNGKFRKITKI